MSGKERKICPKRILGWLPLIFLAACAAPLADLAQDFQKYKPHRIAVLPVTSDTADPDGPRVFRILARAELADLGYGLIDTSPMDEILKGKGVEEAGQIESLTPQEIGEILGADGLLYVNVTSYGRQAGVHLKVGGTFTLVHARTAEKIWFSELALSDDIVLEGGAAVLVGELLGGKDKKKSRETAAQAYLAQREARITKAVARFRAHPIRQEVFQIITIDTDKIYLLEMFFSRNFKNFPRS